MSILYSVSIYLKRLLNGWKTIVHFSKNRELLRVLWRLKRKYLFESPYTLSRKDQEDRQEEEIYIYGETSLLTWENILSSLVLERYHHFLDLGCGMGQLVFFMQCVHHIEATGIDFCTPFIEKAKSLQVENTHFLCAGIGSISLEAYDLIYFNGICIDEHSLHSFERQLDTLKRHSMLISVGMAVGDLPVVKKQIHRYLWGDMEVYYQEKP